MKFRLRLAALALVVGTSLLVVPDASAQTPKEHAANDKPAASAQSASTDSAKAKADYPLTTCVVSGDPLEGGDMGEAIDYVHKEEGKPDRLVRLCCKGCVRDFKKDPAKYLKAIDDAAAGKPHKIEPGAHHH
ncbi:MAG TPA: hypothetical protein VGD81_10065 [Opitutaceae bacterium]